MDGGDGVASRRKSLTERLRFKGMGCCRSTWCILPTTLNVMDNADILVSHNHTPPQTVSRMNLAAALAAERHFRAATSQDSDNEVDNSPSTRPSPSPSPKRMSLMRLLEETDVYDTELTEKDESEGSSCCVCMQRNKGAAMIPCGHTFCRVCSRELWVGRGCCPLCNTSILEILYIY